MASACSDKSARTSESPCRIISSVHAADAQANPVLTMQPMHPFIRPISPRFTSPVFICRSGRCSLSH